MHETLRKSQPWQGKCFQKNTSYMVDAYNDAVRPNYGYLFVDMKPNTDDWMRLRAKIFPDEGPAVVYGKIWYK